MTTRFARGTDVLETLIKGPELDRFMRCEGCNNKLVCSRSDDDWLCWICRYEKAKFALAPIGETLMLQPIPMIEEAKAQVRKSGPAVSRR